MNNNEIMEISDSEVDNTTNDDTIVISDDSMSSSSESTSSLLCKYNILSKLKKKYFYFIFVLAILRIEYESNQTNTVILDQNDVSDDGSLSPPPEENPLGSITSHLMSVRNRRLKIVQDLNAIYQSSHALITTRDGNYIKNLMNYFQYTVNLYDYLISVARGEIPYLADRVVDILKVLLGTPQ